MHLRPINPADRPLSATVPNSGTGASDTTSDLSGVPAIRPVLPADDRTAGRMFDPSRTGVDLSALLRAGADHLVPREQPGAVELAAVLERARAALVRGDPGSTLAALDEAWDGAMRTEGGWYYRAAALALLGLPGDADRVLSQALIPRGGSVALLFLLSVVRSGLSDPRGSRDALASALARSPVHPVLHAWSAVLTARAGDRAGALQRLASIPVGEQSSALLAWARQAVTSATVNAARASTPWSAPVVSATPMPAPVTPLQHALQSLGAQLAHGALVDVRRDVRSLLQSVATGGAFDQASRPDSLAAVRSVLAAMLGVLAREHGEPDNAIDHDRAPRGRLFDGAVNDPGATAGRALGAHTDPHGRWHVSPTADDALHPPAYPSTGTRSALLLALRAGNSDVADTLLQKLPANESASIVDALKHVVAGARNGPTLPNADTMVNAGRPPRGANTGSDSAASVAECGEDDGRTMNNHGVVQSSATRLADPLIAPVRIGLSLLVAQSHRAEANAAVHGALSDLPHVATAVARNGTDVSALSQSSLFAATGMGATGTGMPFDQGSSAAAALAAGAAGMRHAPYQGAPGTPPVVHGQSRYDELSLADAFESGKRLRALALGCMALAFAAMIYGYGAAAIALAGGASWLALRSSTVAAAARRSAQRAAPEQSAH